MHNIKKKVCSKCKRSKNLSEFGKCKKHKDGLMYSCKLCKSAQDKEYRAKNDKKVKAMKKKHYIENKEYIKAKSNKYYEDNKERVKVRNKKYVSANRDKVRKYFRKYHHRKMEECDAQYIVSKRLRSRINRLVKDKTKKGSALKDLGCSLEELIIHIQEQFKDGMSWENYGEWHIDHIVPLASFNLEDRNDFVKACHYTNLQPLWAEDNLKKGAKIL